MSKIEDYANLLGKSGNGEALPPLRSGVAPPVLTDRVPAPGQSQTGFVEPPPAAPTISDGARASAQPQRLLPPTPPDRGAALGEAITARGGNLPEATSPELLRTQMGLRPPPISSIASSARAELPTVERNRFPSPPADNPIANPNARLVPGNAGRSNYVTNEGLEYQRSGAGNRIPDQVGNLKANPVPPQGVPAADGGPRRVAGRGTPVPNMPPPAEPVSSPASARVPPPGTPSGTGAAAGAGGGTAGAGGGSPAPAAGPYSRMTRAASEAARQFVPETLGGASISTSSKLLSGALKTARWAEPAMEAAQVAQVALDKNSSGADVAEQAAVGTGRGAAALAGAGMGAAAGSTLGPVGTFLGGVAGGYLGYKGGDEAIRQLRGMFGLDPRTPAERSDARRSPAKPTAIATAANQAVAPGAGPAASSVPTTSTAQAQNQQGGAGLAARYQALQDEQLASPIAFTLIGNGGGTEIYYKNGNVARLGRGQAAPDEVVRYQALSDQLHAMRNGQQAPAAAAPQAPAAAAPQMQPVTSAQNSSPIQQNIVAEANRQGYDPQLALAKMSLETGGRFNTDAKNPGSSAYGLGQMLVSNRAKYGTEEQWKDPAFQLTSSIDFMKKQDADLGQRLGHMPSPTESYLGHLLGPAGGAALLRANQDLPIEQVVASFTKDKGMVQQIVKKNGMTGLTAGEAVAKWDQLMKQNMASVGQFAAAPAAPLPPSGADGAVPDFRQETPVGVIEGAAQSVELPMPGGGYAKVPRTIMDTGLAQGNARGAVQDYLANQASGIGYAQNPVRAKLDEQAIQTGGEVKRAEIAAQAGRQRFIPIRGGTDPVTYMPLPDRVLDANAGTFLGSGAQASAMPPGMTADKVRANAIQRAKQDRNQLAEINSILARYNVPALTDADLK